MNKKTEERLVKKRDKLQEELEKYILLSSEGFKALDIPLGIFAGFLGIGICVWIPVVGWVLIPLIVIMCPFIGTHLRKEDSKKKVKKLKEELENISIVLQK